MNLRLGSGSFKCHIYIYMCYSPDERSVLEKTVSEVLDTASGGTRDRGHSFSQYGPIVAGE